MMKMSIALETAGATIKVSPAAMPISALVGPGLRKKPLVARHCCLEGEHNRSERCRGDVRCRCCDLEC